MVLSTATETLMLFVDRLFLSRISMLHMSSAMTGGLTSFVFSVLIVGTVDYVNTLTAQHYGAGQLEKANRVLFQGIWFGLFCWPILLPTLFVISDFFAFFGHSQEQIHLESLYYSVLTLGSPLVIIRSAFAAYFIGLGKTNLSFWANGLGMLVNIPLNAVLIFGWGPFPPLGILGAALGTLGGSFVSVVVLVQLWWNFDLSKRARQNDGFKTLRLDPELLKTLVRYGLPMGFETFINTMAFNLFLQSMHSYGEIVGAAITITFNFDMISFFPMFGLGIATSTLVGQYLGADQFHNAQRSTFLSLKLALSYAGVMALIFFFLAPFLVRLFINPLDSYASEVNDLAQVMLRLAALYTLFDAIQIVFRGSLAGSGDTRWILFMSGFLHWALVGLTFWGAHHRWPALWIWGFFIAMVALLGLATALRYWQGKWKSINLVKELKELEPVESGR